MNSPHQQYVLTTVGKACAMVICRMVLNLPGRTKKREIKPEWQRLVASEVVNQVWALYVMHGTLYDGRKLRLQNVIDEGILETLQAECYVSIFPSSDLATTGISTPLMLSTRSKIGPS